MSRNNVNVFTTKGVSIVSKRILVTAILAVALLMLAAAPALAEGYNDPLEYTRATGYNSGPHGGYNSTTNKCQDCHSTHYASGSYMLLRANSREAACDYCHVGGGGSAVNIQMDNEYDADSAVATDTMGFGTGHTLGYSGMAPTDIKPAFQDTEGLACFDCHTPHGNSARTLEAFGIPGRPAGEGQVESVVGVSFMATQMYRIQESMGVVFDFADFNGFTGEAYPNGSWMNIPDDLSQLPHDLDGSAITKWSGSATVIDTVLADGSTTIPAEIAAAGANFSTWMTAGGTPKAPTDAAMGAWWADAGNFDGVAADGKKRVSDVGSQNLMALFGAPNMDLVNLFISWKVYWGEDVDQGNIATGFLNMGNWQQDGGATPGYAGYAPVGPPTVEVWHKPLFPAGRYLLLKNPDSGDDFAGTVNDMGLPAPDFNVASAGQTANDVNGKKVAIDWDWPLGPAATWGPYFYTDNDERFPLAFPWAPKGVSMENEFCTSCHDGAAGLSTQPAEVWYPDQNDSSNGGYVTAYSHDSNARGCARAQYLNPGDDNNFGPHCRNCHTGASQCDQCHDSAGTNWNGASAFGSVDADGVYDDPNDLQYEGVSSYQAVPGVRAGAVDTIGYQCVDGGFSFPHRTLGANMLKDQLYGVDFDGTPIGIGESRMTTAAVESVFGAAYFDDAPRADEVAGQEVQNLDSVCIDCHGDSTYWNGDDMSYYADFMSGDPLSSTGAGWSVQGWELLLKGLP